MRQPVKKAIKKKAERTEKKKKDANEYKDLDGSGLETFFRVNVLEKIGVKYKQQFEAKSIGRFYDFYLPDSRVLLEIDGGYWHSDPRIYEGPQNAIQKRNKRVDDYKDKWALLNGYVLIRFWEQDILNDTQGVIKKLMERLKIEDKNQNIKKSKKDGTFYRKKLK